METPQLQYLMVPHSAVDEDFQFACLDAYQSSLLKTERDDQLGSESDSYDDDYVDNLGEDEEDEKEKMDERDVQSSRDRKRLWSAQFPESQDNVVKLPEDDVASFSVFAEYVYIGNQCDTSAISEGALSSRENINDEYDESEKSDTPGGESELNHGNDGDTSNGDNNEENKNTEGRWKSVGASNHFRESYTLRDDKHCHGVYDKYDFMLQFTCYVLADKLQALGFKRLIMDEIRRHGEFCKPNNVTTEHMQYVYNNTISPVDPLRRFCIMMRFKKMPLEETLEDPEFLELVENGGPLVRDIMRTCRKQTIKQKEKAEEQEQKVSKQREEITEHEQTIKNHKEEIGRHLNSIEMWRRHHRGSQTPTQ